MEFFKKTFRPKAAVIVVIAVVNALILTQMAREGMIPLWSFDKPDYSVQHVQVPAGVLNEADDAYNPEIKNFNVFLEWRLVDTVQEGNFTIETYQEFEIYKSGNQVVKTVGTSNYQYLRYWTQES